MTEITRMQMILGFKTPKKYAYQIPQYFRSHCWKKTWFHFKLRQAICTLVKMTVSTRDRLHNSSFFFKSTHPLSHWLCIVHQQWWEDMKNKVIPTKHLHLHQHPSERQNLDLAKWILTADQINFYLLQWIAQIN